MQQQQFDEFQRNALHLTDRIVAVQNILGHPPYDAVQRSISDNIATFYRHRGEYTSRFQNPIYAFDSDVAVRAERKLARDVNQAEQLLRASFPNLSLPLFDRIDVVEDYLNSSYGSIVKQRPVLDAIYSFNEVRDYFSELFGDVNSNAGGDEISRALAVLNERVNEAESLLEVYKDKEDDTTDEEDYDYNQYADHVDFNDIPAIPLPGISRRHG